MKKSKSFICTILLFLIQNTYSMKRIQKQKRRLSGPRRYTHSPGTYKREFSPRETTLTIIKECHSDEEPITLKLSKTHQQLRKEQLKKSSSNNDQNNKRLCNTK